MARAASLEVTGAAPEERICSVGSQALGLLIESDGRDSGRWT